MLQPPDARCDANGGTPCTVEQELLVDDGFIMCRMFGSAFQGKGASWYMDFTDALPSDASKYLKGHWWGGAPSSNNPLGAYGSDVGFTGMGIVEINTDTSKDERARNNCVVGPYHS